MTIYVTLLLFISKFYITSANFLSQNVANSSTYCDNLLTDFSVSVSNFTYCAIVHAKPITICDNCADSYFNITNSYMNLTKTVINGTKCIDNYINLDRLQIINTIYKNANDLWDRASCYECFTFANGTHKPTKVRKDFENLYKTFYDCTVKFNDSSTNLTDYCNNCIDYYIKLNEFYFNNGDVTHGMNGLCMDIVDLMNKTQANWSKTCCHYRIKNEFIYIVTTIFMIMIPILFYILVYLFVDVKRPKLLPQNRFAESMNTPSTSFRNESM